MSPKPIDPKEAGRVYITATHHSDLAWKWKYEEYADHRAMQFDQVARLAYCAAMTAFPIPLSPERIAVVIPALNEALRIRDVVEGALRHCPNVILVDDGSDDGTVEAVAGLPVSVLTQESAEAEPDSVLSDYRQLAAEIVRQGDQL